jgi:Alpha-acetolactate decarboxylase
MLAHRSGTHRIHHDATLPREVYQTSTMGALIDGDVTIGELLQHGDFGLGTFNHLDGEMLILDGVPRHLGRGVASPWCEDEGAAEGGVRMVRTWDDVEMDVLETLGFGEQCDVGLAAMDDLAERRGDSGQHRAGLRLPGRRQLLRSCRQPHRPAVRISFASRAMVQVPSAPQAQFSQSGFWPAFGSVGIADGCRGVFERG